MRRLVSELFAVPPTSMGMRGDRYLWEAMRKHFYEKRTIIPKTDEAFQECIKLAFDELTSSSSERKNGIFIKEFDKGGMSSGFICEDFWIGQGLQYSLEAYYRASDADKCYQ
ncbi:hypothetical protein QTP81_08135 [Alteromonas sp. ASW11-36]|uniref:Uncharacterized protein n=1 Tax=Alteromonas arenosi TaxID=3055817 RepID=A0ABT7SWJ8_9ALTE|nr:hypothetical protein [Alteromonas sp. ASW11-36]MDM7860562.1 hypothetical protein [Alteromonas sp. ASW11-36]